MAEQGAARARQPGRSPQAAARRLLALGLLIAGFVTPLATARQFILAVAWIWPLLRWSALGNRARLFVPYQAFLVATVLLGVTAVVGRKRQPQVG